MKPDRTSKTKIAEKSVVPASLNEMFVDLARTSSEINQGEFSEGGAGHSGIAYRQIIEKSEDEMSEVWSIILSLCNQLWEEGHQDSSIRLVKASTTAFYIPEAIKDRISQSTIEAVDRNAAIEAEIKFQQGEDDEVIRQVERANGEVKNVLKGHFTQRIKMRKKTRLAAIWVAGTSISMLSVMGIIGFMSFLEMVKEPPKIVAPKYQDSERIFNGIFGGGSTNAENRELNTPAQVEMISDTDRKNTSTFDPSVAPSVTTNPATKQAVKHSTVTRENCIVGFAALQQAIEIINVSEYPESARSKAALFKSDLDTSCKSLNIEPMDLNLEAAAVDKSLARTIAEGVLR